MTKIIEFTDLNSRVYDKEIKKSAIINVPTQKLADSLNLKQLDYEPELFPPGLRYVSGDNSIYVYEQKPQRRTIRFHSLWKEKTTYTEYDIPLPWTILVLKRVPPAVFSTNGNRAFTLYQFFAPTYLSSLEDPLYYSYIANVYENGLVCASIVEAASINQTISNFWSSSFNDDCLHSLLQHSGSLNVSSSEQAHSFYWTLSKLSIEDVLKDGFLKENQQSPCLQSVINQIRDLQGIGVSLEETPDDFYTYAYKLLLTAEQ